MASSTLYSFDDFQHYLEESEPIANEEEIVNYNEKLAEIEEQERMLRLRFNNETELESWYANEIILGFKT